MASAVGARSDGKKGVGGRRPISSRADLVASRSWPCAGRGPVAQLVEQCVYTASVVGSSPAGSTVGWCLNEGSLDFLEEDLSAVRASSSLAGPAAVLVTRASGTWVVSPHSLLPPGRPRLLSGS